MANERIRCPRCNGHELDYIDLVVLEVDFHAIYRDDDGTLRESDWEYNRECYDIPDVVADAFEFKPGTVVCHPCQSVWPSLEALDLEVNVEAHAEAALAAAERQQFGEVGNYAGLEIG